MGCNWIKLADGTVVHLNMPKPRRRRCPFCHNGYVEKECDFQLIGRTCDKGMCSRCAYPVAFNVDYCPEHRPEKART